MSQLSHTFVPVVRRNHHNIIMECSTAIAIATKTTTTTAAEYNIEHATNVSMIFTIMALFLGAATDIISGYISDKVCFSF